MNLFHSLLNLTFFPSAAVKAFDLVGYDDAPIAADDAPVKCIALNPGEIGDATAGMALGTIKIKADGVITAGDDVISSATRGAVKTAGADPSNAFAKALTTVADGELVEILIR